MSEKTSLKFALNSALKDCLGVGKADTVLVLCDETQKELGRLFMESLVRLTSTSFYLQIPPLSAHWHEPSDGLTAFMTQFSAILMATNRSLFHTNARRSASKHGARILSLAARSPDNLTRTLTGDYKPIVEKSRKIADIFTIGRQAALTSPAGTDLTFAITRMKGFADTGLALEPGQCANLPGGEACVSPLPDTMNGTLVIDGSCPEIGPLTDAISVSIKNGCIHRISGGKDAEKLRKILQAHGKPAKTVAEVGVGVNPNAVLTGNSLEDEKVMGTAHLAFGNNLSYDGKIGVPCHVDGILLKPTLTIDSKVVVENGVINV
jgi:leucyl aminopeptidase (aminopeptidase T)